MELLISKFTLIEKLQSPENQFTKPVVLSNPVIRYRVACTRPSTVQQTASDSQNKQAYYQLI